MVKDLELFARKLMLKNMYQKPQEPINLTPKENQAIDQLVSLLEESDMTDLIDRIDLPTVLSLPKDNIGGSTQASSKGSKLKKKLIQFPPPNSNPNLYISEVGQQGDR